MTTPEVDTGLKRPRLEARLALESLPSLTVVTGGAGTGKTTLLGHVFDSRFSVWHTLSPTDRALPVLTRNVVRRLRLTVPQLSAEVVAAVEGGSGPRSTPDPATPQAIAAALAQDLDLALEREVVLVLDDFHEIGAGDSADFVAALCRHAPRGLRVVIASRLPLPFPVSRMRMSGDVLEISANDLVFTRDEISELLTRRHGGERPGMAAEIHAATGGWPVAVILAIEAGGDGEGPSALSMAEESGLFDYLAEEVMTADWPASLALQQAALLPWFTPELLQHLEIEPSHLLPSASVYLSRAPDRPHAYIVSRLVRDYFATRHRVDPDVKRSILVRASRWYAADDSHAEALQCLLDAGDPEETGRHLTEHGEILIAAGHTREVTKAIGTLGDGVLPEELALLDAEARQLLGDWEGAMDRYRLVVPETGPIPPRVAWRLGFLHHMRGEVAEALATYERAERGTADRTSEAALLGWQASAHWLRGERDRASELATEALDLARLSRDRRSMATAHTVLAMVAALDGDRSGNDMHYLKALEYSEQSNDVVQTMRIRANRASAFLEEGEFGPALAEIQIALRLADMTGFELWRAMSLSNRAQVGIYQGRLEEAVADLTEARTTFRRIGSRLEAYPLGHLGDVYRIRGDTARARSAYEEAIRLATSQHDLQGSVPAMSGLARLMAPHEPDEAVALSKVATEVDSVIGRVQALAAAGWAAHHSGQREQAQEVAEEATETARARRDMPGLAEALELTAVVRPDSASTSLEEAEEIWSRLQAPIGVARVELARAEITGGATGSARAAMAAETLRRYGAMGLARRARQLADSLAQTESVHPVAIKTLGGFDVITAGHPTPRSAWQSKVAREVLWMLIAARGRPINREVLIDRLWPDDDINKASNRLSVALSIVRRVLDTEDSHDSDRHIVADRDSVRIDLDSVTIDVEVFLREAATGRRLLERGQTSEGLVHLRAAEDRYVGEFLEEEPFADWAISLREQARSEYLTVAAKLAEAAESEGDHEGAARRYLRMLERDVYNEPAHLGVIKAMSRSGRHGTARRLYGIYVSRMTELDLEPEPFPEASGDTAHS